MGWRISLYALEKNKKISDLMNDKDEYFLDKMENVIYDFCTDLWIRMHEENEEFNKSMEGIIDDGDIVFYRVSKEGFRMFIEGIRQKHIDYLNRLVDKIDPEDINSWRKITYENYIKDEISHWKSDFDENCGLKFDYKRKYMINFGITWEDAFYNALFVYKVFDWENKDLYFYGG